ncbi:MAG: hypothetical protein E7167_05870 [Firmicutes bacterium]|nr:hypothetical protein [Bacillota bacterium]
MEIIVLIIIISLLALILFLALKKLIENITSDSKEYYFKKMQDYDAKIFEKEEKLSSLTPLNNEEIVKDKERVIQRSAVDRDLLNVLNSTDYEMANALKIANKVDEIFKIDEEQILKDFISKVKVNENYKTYQMLQDRFSPNLIYKLKLLNSAAQIKVISKMISDEEYEVFNSYVTTRKFKLDKFLLDLDLLIENNIPKIEVIVGNKTKNYDYLSPNIKTTYSDDIYKGMIIKYQDRIYDYSINERDV